MKPFRVIVPPDILDKIEKNISEEEIKVSQKILEKYEIEFVCSDVKEKVGLTPDELAFTFDIHLRPFLNFTDRIRGVFTNYKASNLKEELISRNILKGISIRLKRKGNPDLFLELSDKWHELTGVEKNNKGKGSFKHRLFQHIVAEYFRTKGKKVKVEALVGADGDSKLIDVLVDKTQPFEIETGSSGQEVYNAEFCLKYFSSLVVVTPIENHATIKERILRGIKADSKRVKFCSIDAFTGGIFDSNVG